MFGIGVGFELVQIPNCNALGGVEGDRLCIDSGLGRWTRTLDQLGVGRQSFAESGLRLLAVQVNDQMMDTSLLFGLLGQSAALDVAIDQGRIVQYVSAQTKITATEQVLQMLTSKYGRTSRTEWTEWKNARTGALVRRTPVYLWDLSGLSVEFHTQHASTIGQMETPMGRF